MRLDFQVNAGGVNKKTDNMKWLMPFIVSHLSWEITSITLFDTSGHILVKVKRFKLTRAELYKAPMDI